MPEGNRTSKRSVSQSVSHSVQVNIDLCFLIKQLLSRPLFTLSESPIMPNGKPCLQQWKKMLQNHKNILKVEANCKFCLLFYILGTWAMLCYAMLCYARMAQHIFYFSFFCSWSSFRLIEFTPTFFFLLLEDFCLVYNCSLLTFKLLFYLINIHKSLLGIKTDFCYFTNKHFETILEQNCFLISSK